MHDFWQEILQTLANGWETFCEEQRGNAEILLESLRALYARSLPKAEKQEIKKSLPREWLFLVEPVIHRLGEYVDLEGLRDHPHILACAKTATWGEVLASAKQIQKAGLPIPPPQDLISKCFDVALTKCLESYM